MPIVSSAVVVDDYAQADGRRYAREVHVLDDGVELEFTYLAAEGLDCQAVALERAQALNEMEPRPVDPVMAALEDALAARAAGDDAAMKSKLDQAKAIAAANPSARDQPAEAING